MLDDLKYIHERDAQDALGIAEKQWEQLKYDYKTAWVPQKADFKPKSIVLGGMGGSALAGLILQSWPQISVPFEVVRNYELPKWVNDETLFIASSYSGNTEETLAACQEAAARGCEVAVVTAGGKLADVANENGYTLFKLPSGLQPRHAVFYSLAALVQLLIPAGALDQDKLEELREAGEWLKNQIPSWRPDIATKDNEAKKIALECIGKSVVVYAGPKLYSAAYKWKISFNENAKHVAWVNQFPEFNHNEMLGWTKQPVDKPYTVIELHTSLDNERVKKRFEVTEQLLSGLRPSPIVVNAQGDTLLKQLVWTIALGDFVTLYTALLNGINPTPVELIEKFKTSLG